MEWISDYWNIADLANLVLFGIGFTLRLLPSASALSAARVILALDLGIFYIRILHMFSIFKNLGPKLIMIGRMVSELMSLRSLKNPFVCGLKNSAQWNAHNILMVVGR